MAKRYLVFLLCFSAFSHSCDVKDREPEEAPELIELTLPATKTEGVSLLEALESLNGDLAVRYPDHPYLPIIVQRAVNPSNDLGNARADFSFPEQALFARIRHLSEGTMSHWELSENGFIIFNTWHRPHYSSDDLAPEELKALEKSQKPSSASSGSWFDNSWEKLEKR